MDNSTENVVCNISRLRVRRACINFKVVLHSKVLSIILMMNMAKNWNHNCNAIWDEDVTSKEQ